MHFKEDRQCIQPLCPAVIARCWIFSSSGTFSIDPYAEKGMFVEPRNSLRIGTSNLPPASRLEQNMADPARRTSMSHVAPGSRIGFIDVETTGVSSNDMIRSISVQETELSASRTLAQIRRGSRRKVFDSTNVCCSLC